MLRLQRGTRVARRHGKQRRFHRQTWSHHLLCQHSTQECYYASEPNHCERSCSEKQGYQNHSARAHPHCVPSEEGVWMKDSTCVGMPAKHRSSIAPDGRGQCKLKGRVPDITSYELVASATGLDTSRRCAGTHAPAEDESSGFQ